MTLKIFSKRIVKHVNLCKRIDYYNFALLLSHTKKLKQILSSEIDVSISLQMSSYNSKNCSKDFA